MVGRGASPDAVRRAAGHFAGGAVPGEQFPGCAGVPGSAGASGAAVAEGRAAGEGVS
jgi:hypothetical protein